MSQTFESDVMDELSYDAAEGPAQMRYDEFDEFDAGEDEFDEFAGGFEEMDEFAEADQYEDTDVLDAMEDAVADALGADDTDEFFRAIGRGIRSVARVARRVAPVVGRIARTVAPIASAIPLPWTQAIGRVAGVVGRVMADEADEFEALEEMFDLAEDEEAIDAAAPVIAGLAIRRAMPGVSRLPRATRRQLVRSVSRSTRMLARRQGPQAARAIPRVVQGVQRTARRRRLPARALPQAVQRAATQVARSPRLVRQLARPVVPARALGGIARSGIARSGIAHSGIVHSGIARGGAVCPTCARRRIYNLCGPVRLIIQGQ